MPDKKSLYDILNVTPSSSVNDIKKSYYKLAKIHHPDKLSDKNDSEVKNAEEKFKEIKFAYEVLTDKTKRDIYDKYGLEGLKDGIGGTEFEDIFGSLFGGFGGSGGNPFGFPFDLFGGSGMGRGGRKQKHRTQNLVYPLKVTLSELYCGATKYIELDRSIICNGCKGSGGKSGSVSVCKSCSGRGVTMQYKQLGLGMMQQMQVACRECKGEGELISEKDRCKQCVGKKTVKQKKKFEINVDKGMRDSQKITYRGESNQEPDCETGDLIVVLQQIEHETFSRQNDDLNMTHSINITEALCGFKLVVTHLDGRALVITHSSGRFLAPGSVRAICKEGMPIYKNPFEKGNLYIKFNVKFPENNSISEEAIKKLEKLLPPKPRIEIPTGEHVDEVSMIEYESTKGKSGSKKPNNDSGLYETYGDDEVDYDEDEMGAGQGVQCNTH